ncbi:MAG: HAD hydrolase family protein [Telluria sp.]
MSRHDVAGIGDAENDRAFLDLCECGAATANAVAALKGASDHVTAAPNGAGVREFAEALLRDDLSALPGCARVPEAAGT